MYIKCVRVGGSAFQSVIEKSASTGEFKEVEG